MEGEEFTLSDQQEQHLKKCFDDFDKDGSGRLDVKELQEAMQLIGLNPSPQEVRECMEKHDLDDSGSLDFEEFKNLILPIIQSAMREMRQGFEEAFKEFDKDGSGKLDKDEFRDAVTNKGDSKLTDEEVEDLFQAVDTDDDGKIDMQEMINLFCAVFEAFMNQQEGQEE